MVGFSPTAESPVLRARPYRSLKEPFFDGFPNTGLPAIKSSKNPPFFFSTFIFTNRSIHSQPSIPSFSTCLFIFGAFIDTPSARTSTIPPLILFVATLSRSLYPPTSLSSVGSPSMQIGQFLTISFISSSVGVYCKPLIRSYSETSNTYLPISSSLGEYAANPILLLI